jgi:hypothetical protein
MLMATETEILVLLEPGTYRMMRYTFDGYALSKIGYEKYRGIDRNSVVLAQDFLRDFGHLKLKCKVEIIEEPSIRWLFSTGMRHEVKMDEDGYCRVVVGAPIFGHGDEKGIPQFYRVDVTSYLRKVGYTQIVANEHTSADRLPMIGLNVCDLFGRRSDYIGYIKLPIGEVPAEYYPLVKRYKELESFEKLYSDCYTQVRIYRSYPEHRAVCCYIYSSMEPEFSIASEPKKCVVEDFDDSTVFKTTILRFTKYQTVSKEEALMFARVDMNVLEDEIEEFLKKIDIRMHMDENRKEQREIAPKLALYRDAMVDRVNASRFLKLAR